MASIFGLKKAAMGYLSTIISSLKEKNEKLFKQWNEFSVFFYVSVQRVQQKTGLIWSLFVLK